MLPSVCLISIMVAQISFALNLDMSMDNGGDFHKTSFSCQSEESNISRVLLSTIIGVFYLRYRKSAKKNSHSLL